MSTRGENATADLDLVKLLAARRVAVAACPYLATALHAMAVVPTYQVPTMSVDRYWRCYVSPRFVAAQEVGALAFVWLHEVSHLVRDHHSRADALWRRSERHGAAAGTPALDLAQPARERLRLNLAMDCEINDDLVPSFAGFGSGARIENGRRVWTGAAAGRGEPSGPVPRAPEGVVTPQRLRIAKSDLFEQYVRALPSSVLDGRLAWLDCGSGAHGGACGWEWGADGAHPVGRYEAAAIRIRVREALLRGRGTTSAGWRRWAEGITEPSEDWRVLLGAAFRACVAAVSGGAGDYTYRRPGRRTPSLGGKVVLPACDARCRRWPSSSTPRVRSATPTWAAPSGRSRASAGRSAYTATGSPSTVATPRCTPFSACAGRRRSASSAAAEPTCARASPAPRPPRRART